VSRFKKATGDAPEAHVEEPVDATAVADAMTAEEQAALDRALECSLAEADAGQLIDADEVLAELEQRR
jgi:hypothetical protein